VAWVLCGVLVVFFAGAWRAWEPYCSIYRSGKRIDNLRRQLRDRRVQEAELRYRLATVSTVAGVERAAMRRGLGPAGAVALRPVWQPEEEGAEERGLYGQTYDWARGWWQRRLSSVCPSSPPEDRTEPTSRSLSLP